MAVDLSVKNTSGLESKHQQFSWAIWSFHHVPYMIFNAQTQSLINVEIEGNINFKSHWVKYCTFNYFEEVFFKILQIKIVSNCLLVITLPSVPLLRELV